jgi:hypothetical protein
VKAGHEAGTSTTLLPEWQDTTDQIDRSLLMERDPILLFDEVRLGRCVPACMFCFPSSSLVLSMRADGSAYHHVLISRSPCVISGSSV